MPRSTIWNSHMLQDMVEVPVLVRRMEALLQHVFHRPGEVGPRHHLIWRYGRWFIS